MCYIAGAEKIAFSVLKLFINENAGGIASESERYSWLVFVMREQDLRHLRQTLTPTIWETILTNADTNHLGSLLHRITAEQAEWSQATFGSDQERGPTGALLHLEKEAREALESPHDVSEFADCLLLVLDASRRAGFDTAYLLAQTYEKLQICKQRKWPKPDGDLPVEHIKE